MKKPSRVAECCCRKTRRANLPHSGRGPIEGLFNVMVPELLGHTQRAVLPSAERGCCVPNKRAPHVCARTGNSNGCSGRWYGPRNVVNEQSRSGLFGDDERVVLRDVSHVLAVEVAELPTPA